jgi:hypothetical protein
VKGVVGVVCLTVVSLTHRCFLFCHRYLRIIYETIDSESTGRLNLAEVRESFVLVIDITLTDDEFNTIYSELDQDADGSVSFHEFKKYFKNSEAIRQKILDKRAG